MGTVAYPEGLRFKTERIGAVMLRKILFSRSITNVGANLRHFLDVASNLQFERQPLPLCISIGRHTYGLTRLTISNASENTKVTIGSFCSFAPGVQILAHVDHPTDLPSLFPFRTKLFNSRAKEPTYASPNTDAVSKGPVTIGHDVWLGANAIILSGVTIGTGAVVGAGAVVTKDVPPYAIVVGNPAAVVRHRFAPDIIARLLDSHWWDLPDDKLVRLESELYDTNIERFLRSVTRVMQDVTAVGTQEALR